MYAMMFPFYAIPKYGESEFFAPPFTPTPAKSKDYRHLTEYAFDKVSEYLPSETSVVAIYTPRGKLESPYISITWANYSKP